VRKILTWKAALIMSSDFAWSLSKAYTLSFVGLYVTMYLSSYKMLVIPKEQIKIAGNIHIYENTVFLGYVCFQCWWPGRAYLK